MPSPVAHTDERAALDIQLAEHVSFSEALFEPRALGLNAGVSLLRADDAAQVFVFNIFRSKVDKLSVHIRPVPFVIYNCRMPLTSYSDGSTAHAMRRTASDGAFYVRHTYHVYPRGIRRLDSGLAVLKHEAVLRALPSFLACFEKNIRCGLAVLDLGSEDHIVKVPVHAVIAQHSTARSRTLEVARMMRTPRALSFFKKLLGAWLQRYAAVEIYLFI